MKTGVYRREQLGIQKTVEDKDNTKVEECL